MRNLYESYKTRQIGYRIQKSYDVDSCVSIQFSKDGKQYNYLLSYWSGEWSSWIENNDGDNVGELFPDIIKIEGGGETRLKQVLDYLNKNGYQVNW